MRGLTNKPVLFPLRLTKKSLVTLNSPPSGRRSTRRGRWYVNTSLYHLQ